MLGPNNGLVPSKRVARKKSPNSEVKGPFMWEPGNPIKSLWTGNVGFSGEKGGFFNELKHEVPFLSNGSQFAISWSTSHRCRSYIFEIFES